MGLSQSYLSQSAYGYDTVSSVDVNGLNGILKKYYTNSAAKFTATTLYFIKDSTGNPQVIELADLLKQTNSIDPLTVKSTDATSVNTIKNSVFYFAFKFTPGNPSTVASFKYNYLQFVLGTQNVIYTLCCQDIQLVFFDTEHNIWVNASQSQGSILYNINATIALQNIMNNNNLPSNVQSELNDLGNQGLSVYQLLFDFDTAVLDPSTTIPVLTKDNAIYTPLLQQFIPAYLTAFNNVVSPVLNYSVVQPNSATLMPTSMDFCFEQVVGANGNVISNPNATETSQCTLNYLFATNDHSLPAPKQFNWNWLDAGDVTNYNGAMAINRNSLAAYFDSQLKKYVNENCWIPVVSGNTSLLGNEYDVDINYGTYGSECGVQPFNINDLYAGTTDTLLLYLCNGKGNATGWSAGDTMTVTTHYQLLLSVDLPESTTPFLSRTLTLSQTLWISVDATGSSDFKGHTPYNGSPVYKTFTDTFSVIVDPQGNVNLANTNSQVQDDSDNPNNVPEYVSAALSRWVAWATAAGFTQVPFSMPKQFIFPGGDTFTFTNAGFSNYSDLVCNVTYNNVSS
jgi:hypothetical protein